ncbi:hypothetical protein FQA39_LY01426 [Lamprigera yunnana]|nr:hypothetical protein FQA39_LY01426 [Lamprigera yunnana]
MMEDNENDRNEEEKEPQATSSDPEERKLARRLRIKRRLEAIRKTNLQEGDEEEEIATKTLLQDQLRKSYELLDKATVETMEYITNVRVANESREINRRESDDVQRKHVLEYLQNEASIAEQHFNIINEKWLSVFDYKDPLLINDEFMNQKEKCDQLIKLKDAVVTKLKLEVTKAEDKFATDQKRQVQDIHTLTERIENQLALMRKAYEQELKIIEEVMMVERKILIDTNDNRWEELHKQRDLEEQLNCEKKFEQLDEFDQICTNLRIEHQEKYREVNIMLGNNIEELQRELEKIKCVALINGEKLDYNYQLLQKRETENILIKSQQKRRINKLQDGINSQKAKIKEYTQTTNQQTEKLSTEIYKLRDSVLDIETKADTFCKVNDTKYNQVWDFNKKRASKLLQQILNIDKVLYEQQLGLNWNHPPNALMEKTELPSYRSALQVITEIPKPDDNEKPTETESTVERIEDKVTLGETMAHRRILRMILNLIADKSGFLIEEKLKDILQPYAEDENALLKIDCVFMVKISVPQDALVGDMLSVVHQPNEVIDVIVSALTVSVNDNVSTSPELKDDIEQPDVSRRSTIVYSSELDKLKSSKLRESTSKSCYRKHPLLISSIYILRALREFFTKFYVVKRFNHNHDRTSISKKEHYNPLLMTKKM